MHMKNKLPLALAFLILAGSLSGCADPVNAPVGENPITSMGSSETREKPHPPVTELPETEPKGPSVDPALLPENEGKTVYYVWAHSTEPCYVVDAHSYCSAVAVAADQSKTFYNQLSNFKWIKLPECRYRSDLYWQRRKDDAGYTDYAKGCGCAYDYDFFYDVPTVEDDGLVYEDPTMGRFYNEGEIELRSVWRVDFRSYGTRPCTLYWSDFYPDLESCYEAEEAYLESFGFEILRDHRYARQRDGVAIEDAELLVVGTLEQAEALYDHFTADRHCEREDGSYLGYTLYAASYVHYAPEELVDVDPSLILDRARRSDPPDWSPAPKTENFDE